MCKRFCNTCITFWTKYNYGKDKLTCLIAANFTNIVLGCEYIVVEVIKTVNQD